MSRLLVVNPTEISRDPRARRQLLAAASEGWEVVGVCGQLSGLEPIPLQLPVRRVGRRRPARTRRAGSVDTARRRRGSVEREVRGLARLLRLARLNVQLIRAARHVGRVDLVHANELETLVAATVVASRSNARLVYDAHELYASSEPDYPRTYTAVTVPLERALARRAHAVTTVSEPIAEELAERLRLPRRPTPVLNCPERVPGIEPERMTGPLRAVYQGAMGRSRPLADVLAAAAAAPSVQLTIRVAGADRESLRREAHDRGLDGRVDIVEPVAPTAGVEALAGEEVGLVINRPLSRNDELVFPNKLFEYLMAGLAGGVPPPARPPSLP